FGLLSRNGEARGFGTMASRRGVSRSSPGLSALRRGAAASTAPRHLAVFEVRREAARRRRARATASPAGSGVLRRGRPRAEDGGGAGAGDGDAAVAAGGRHLPDLPTADGPRRDGGRARRALRRRRSDLVRRGRARPDRASRRRAPPVAAVLARPAVRASVRV